MTNDNSSLPLLLTITGAVVVVAVGGWFFLDQDSAPPAAVAPADEPTVELSPTSETLPAVDAAAANDEPTVTTPTATTPESSPSIAEVNLRKAQLAAGSDILVFPEDSSALYYYGLVLSEQPDNAIARAERDSVLATIAQTVTAHLAAEEYSDAYDIATLVARQVPDHSLVTETQRVLDERATTLIDEAIQLAREGEDAQADELLADAEALPGRNPDYFVAVRESVAEIRDVRNAAEQERQRRVRLAAEQAKSAWVEQVRGAIADGNLIFPAGASAADLLTESNDWNAEREQLYIELRTALTDAVNAAIDNGDLDEAEVMLDHARSMEGATDDLDQLRAALESAFVYSQSQRVMQISDLTGVNTEPPAYPRRALQLDISGWVDVYFTVTPQGNTTDVEIASFEPSDIFNSAAIRAVEQWEFEPVQYRGQAISQRVATRLSFELD